MGVATAKYSIPDSRPRRPQAHRLSVGVCGALIAPAVVAIAVRVLTGAHPVDDAFITFRYARNLANGLGLVYNPGESVLGSTAPAWAAILALVYRMGATDLPRAAATLSAILDGASALLLALLALRMGWPPLGAALVGSAWGLNSGSIAFAAGGMETSPFIVLILGTLTLAIHRHSRWAAALAGAGTLVRPESALLVPIVLAWEAWGSRQVPWRSTALAATPAVLWAALQTLLFGSPVPHSVLAKQIAYQGSSPVTNLGAFTVEWLMPGWSPFLLGSLPGSEALAILAGGLLVATTLTWAAARRMARHTREWLPFATFALLLLGFYVVAGIRGARVWPWYLVPAVPLYLLLAAAGLKSLRPRPQSALALALLLWQLPAIDWQRPFLPLGEDLRREAAYLAIGEDLARQLPAGSVVAAPEIGALGYASNLAILDTVGLVSPVASAYYPLPANLLVSDNAVPPRLIQDVAPDAVVALDEFVRLSLEPDPWFRQHYALAFSVSLPVWASQNVLVFLRQESPMR